MHFYTYFTVLAALAASVSPTLSAPTHYRYTNLLVEFKSRAFPDKWNSSRLPRSQGSFVSRPGSPGPPGPQESEILQATSMPVMMDGSTEPVMMNYLPISKHAWNPSSTAPAYTPLYPHTMLVGHDAHPSEHPPEYDSYHQFNTLPGFENTPDYNAPKPSAPTHAPSNAPSRTHKRTLTYPQTHPHAPTNTPSRTHKHTLTHPQTRPHAPAAVLTGGGVGKVAYIRGFEEWANAGAFVSFPRYWMVSTALYGMAMILTASTLQPR